MYVNKCCAVVNTDMERLDRIFITNEFHRYNPFIYKYQMVETNPDFTVFEDEMNLFGFNKTAICYKQIFKEMNGNHYHLFLNVIHPMSRVLPFRDSHMLYTCYVFQQISSSQVKISYMTQTQPVPWYHSSNPQIALYRQQLALNRYFSVLLDCPTTKEIPSYISVERTGFDKVLPGYNLSGKYVYSDENIKIVEHERFKDEINFLVQGKYEARSTQNLNKDEIVRILFQERCKVIENNSGSFVLHKGYSKDYQVTQDHIKMSIFQYSSECVLVNIHSIHSAQCGLAHTHKNQQYKIFHFNTGFIFFSKDEHNMWNLQFYFDMIQKDSNELNYTIFLTFLDNMRHAFATSPDFREDLSPVLKFSLETKPVEKCGFFPRLKSKCLQLICSYLSKKDILSLQMTNKHICLLVRYAEKRDAPELFIDKDKSSSSETYSGLKDKLISCDSNSTSGPKQSDSGNKDQLSLSIDQECLNQTQMMFQKETLNENFERTEKVERSDKLPKAQGYARIEKPDNFDSLSSLSCFSKSDKSEKKTSMEFETPTDHNENSEQNPIMLEGHFNVVRSVAIHPKEDVFVSGSSDRKIRLWEFNNPRENSRVFVGPNSSITDVNFIGEHICTAYKCGTIKYIHPNDPPQSFIFDAVIGKIEGFYPVGFTDFVAWNECVEIISYHDVKQTVLFKYAEHQRKVTIVRPLTNYVFLSGSSDRTVHIWDTRQHCPTVHRLKPHKSGVIQMEVVDSEKFCTVGNEKIVNLWDIRNLKSPVFDINNKTEMLRIGENRIFCGGEDNNVRIYNLNADLVIELQNQHKESGLSSMACARGHIVTGMKNGSVFVFNNVMY
ncbi:F-box and WD domain protein, putative [Entamoeba invadens IP1]|uniref:F-box and WD domain protein, putative n=1 Tax=Entamoeba invadens IP1 TaxID=370355 RepID=UPI0002C3DCC8|nr:F-box and WD domain protein, putative [Entamoeba invadens IP1]ELP93441.1 F-box and WD domain protein, putative [Entamoeba invadens IP1]|eukprot:XP_004260212.1 F-box and WD domain protein, putative [Entamoeba invadens IP1]